MSATAAAAGPAGADPLAPVLPVLNAFRTQAARSASALGGLTGRIRSAATATGGIRASVSQSGQAVSRVKSGADAAARSVTRLGQSAARAGTGMKSFGDRARSAARSVGLLRAGLATVTTLLAGLAGTMGVVGDLMGAFGLAMTIGGGVMMVINLLTRANPIGFVAGLLLPVAGWLIDLAVSSEAGQRIIEQLATIVLKYVEGYLAVITPVLNIIGNLVSTYFGALLTIVSTVLSVVGAVVGTGFAVLQALTTGNTQALREKVDSVWRGFQGVLESAVNWITHSIPDMFQRIKNAMSSTLGGIGRFLGTGVEMVAGLVKAPINGLIAFANWIIDGLNSLSVNILGKTFGVNIPKIPMLAEGGVAVPGIARRAGKVLPLTALEQQRALASRRRAPSSSPYRLAEFREAEGAGSRATAEDLLFLASAHAHP
ncbi:tape-measure protein [Streptomyces sp. NPDC047042]|uniref:tape-measure protein n=1 Tax=Streptomyces sp. NPDC047042 TaxID=3154807 RepID=UPI0033D8DF00